MKTAKDRRSRSGPKPQPGRAKPMTRSHLKLQQKRG